MARNRNTEGPALVGHDVSTTPPVLAAELAQAWADIQRYHPELPDLAAPESLIGESSSACGAELSFERLLHEAVHGIAAARGVRDTSRARPEQQPPKQGGRPEQGRRQDPGPPTHTGGSGV
ncbi:hypothetical protein ACIOEZ_06620, partial [Streptomyces sp. NPDC087866]